MKITLFCFVFFLITINNCNQPSTSDIIMLNSKDDAIKIIVKKEVTDSIDKKTFNFIFGDTTEYSETLVRYVNKKDIYLEVESNNTFLIRDGIALRANSFLRFYLDKNFLNNCWYSYEQKNSDNEEFDPLILKKITLKNIYRSNEDTLFQFVVEDESDLIKEYTYDQKLNLEKLKIIYTGSHAYEKEYIFIEKSN